MVDIATFVRPFFFRFMSAFGKIRKEIEEKKAREEQAQEEADSTDAGTSLGIAIGNLILTIERGKEQERERNLSQLNARIDELSKEVLTLTKEVYTLRTALMDFSKAVSKRDQELVNAINRKGSYSISSEFTINFSQFGETY